MNILDDIQDGFEDLAKEQIVATEDIDEQIGEDETTGGEPIVPRKSTIVEENVFGSSTSPPSSQKWWISIVLGLIFFILASPIAYKLTGIFTTAIGGMDLFTFRDTYPAQTLVALTIHSVIFILIVRLILW